MLSFQDFFKMCAGLWTTERTSHSTLTGEVERSFTEFRVISLTCEEKQKILPVDATKLRVDTDSLAQDDTIFPGFSIAFDTRSEKGEEVSMRLNALFIPDRYILSTTATHQPPLPVAAQVPDATNGDIIQGFYLRDEGYSEAGAIAGRCKYHAARQTLEITT